MQSQEPASAAEAIMSGRVWRDFCTRLMEAGEAILRPEAPQNLFDRTEGFRYLTRLLRIGLIQSLEAADVDFPFFYRPSDEISKYGGDNPDNVYWSAMVRGSNDYRISGHRGSMHYWSIGSKAYRMDLDGTIVSTGELRGEDVDWGPDGNFQIIVSARPQPGKNWLPMKTETNFLLIRQTYLDRRSESPGTYHIERIGGPAAPRPLDPERLLEALRRTTDFVRGNAWKFGDFIQPFLPHINVMPRADQQYLFRAGGDPAITYRFGHYRLAPDEALLVTVTPPTCAFWNFSVYNWWLESFDYRYLPVSLNGHSARRNADGSITIVLAEHDPGVSNWINTAGHLDGIALFRWVDAQSDPDPQCSVVRTDELAHVLKV
jgi:hypothetical protein